MLKLHPYLNFPGTSEEAFNFYKSVFGGEFLGVNRFKDTPDGAKLSPEEANKIMHISLPVGENVLMATDALESMGFKLNQGNDSYIMIAPESKEEADRIFRGLSQDGKVNSPMQNMFWGDYYGDFVDKYGVRWMINYSPNSPA